MDYVPRGARCISVAAHISAFIDSLNLEDDDKQHLASTYR